MKIPDLSSKFTGNWQGTHRLVLSWLPEPDFISASNLAVKSIANDKFLVLSYDWHHQGTSQDGLLLIGNIHKTSDLTASWADSWGMSGKIMNCYGTIDAQGGIAVLGSYEVQDHPDWGWRIEITCPTDEALQLMMYNISPEGEETLAVDATYKRVTPPLNKELSQDY